MRQFGELMIQWTGSMVTITNKKMMMTMMMGVVREVMMGMVGPHGSIVGTPRSQ